MARTFASYVTHLNRFGPEGVRAAAQRDLSEEELAELDKLIDAYKRSKRKKRQRG